jgi:hypothetical protein
MTLLLLTSIGLSEKAVFLPCNYDATATACPVVGWTRTSIGSP